MMRSIQWCAVALCATSLAAQFPQVPGPDIVLPDGSTDGFYRFVDRDASGDYDFTAGEVYDYMIANGVDTSFRSVVFANGFFYTTGNKTDKIWKAWDVNGDGTIDWGTESSIAMDPAMELFGATHNPLDIVTDGLNLYYASYSGSSEGIWKLTDLNGDGDFQMSLGEIIGAAVEISAGGAASIPIANAVNTPGAFCDLLELQSMSFDPTVSAGSLAVGRLLVESEANNNECTLAFEDKNNDGDFYDAGECYIFLNLCDSSARGLWQDASPAMASFPVGYNQAYYEIEHVLVDTSGPSFVYYVISEDSTGVPSGNTAEHGIIFRCEDLNGDADVNDLGECTVWFDCSTDSTLGATNEYRWITGSGIYNGDLYLALQHVDPSGVNDEDHVVALRDVDGSGVIDQPNEMVVLHRQNNQTMYNLLCLPPGFLAAPPAGVPGYYEYIGPAACASSGGGIHNIVCGADNWSDKLVAGNTVSIRMYGGAFSAPTALHIGVPVLPPFPLDTAGDCLFSVQPLFAATGLATDSAGDASIALPFTSGLIGFPLHWQYVTLDAGQSLFNVTTSDVLVTNIGNFSFTQN